MAPQETAAVDVVPAPESGRPDARRPSGVDPHLVHRAPLLASLPTGAVEISWNLWRAVSSPIEVELHVDCGDGFSEDTKIVLPTTTGGRLRVPIELPPGLRRLRIDLPATTGPFVLSDLRLRRLAAAPGVQMPLWRGPSDAYRLWVAAAEADFDAERDQVRARIAGMGQRPTFSVLLPVHDPPPEVLRAAIDRVRAQLWPHWELCICDDASSDPAVRTLLDEAADGDRVRLVRREVSGNISAASNDALALARGDWIVLLDHDDLLHERALFEVAAVLEEHPDAAVVYSDEDKVDADGDRFDPYFKPDLSRELLWGQNLVSHLGAYRRDHVEAVGGFRSEFDGSQDYDLVLRVLERCGIAAIRHIPKVLYHWRVLPGSLAAGDDEKTWAHDAATRALRDHLARQSIDAEVTAAGRTRYRRVIPALPATPPTVTVIIPTRDRPDLLSVCVESLLALTSYDRVDLLLVDNGSVEPEALGLLARLAERPEVSVLRDDGDFNWSRLNNQAAAAATGEFVCLLNDDIEVVESDWLAEMVRWASLPGVGAVGARLDYPDGRLQHAGVVLGLGGEASHAYQLLPSDTDGQMGRARLVQQYQAVTGACMLTPRRLLLDAGGFDQEHLAVAYSDLDYCLRLRQRGLAIVWTPYARLLHRESASRGAEVGPAEQRRSAEAAVLRDRWPKAIEADPFFNPNLSRDHTDFRPAQQGYES